MYAIKEYTTTKMVSSERSADRIRVYSFEECIPSIKGEHHSSVYPLIFVVVLSLSLRHVFIGQ